MTQPILANKGAVTMSTQLTAPKAYKRSPSLENSTWYKGILMSQIAEKSDNGGVFDLTVAKIRKGTEPPPHVHARDDEFFYILSGSIRFYTEGQVFDVGAGESMFLPKGKPHAFQIQSDEIHSITLITPGGFLNAVNQMNEPAQKMEIPSDDVLTYANMDLTKTKEIFETMASTSFLQRKLQNRCQSFHSRSTKLETRF
jgi:quercetin dioxygenase-like cupin family protein